LYIKMQGPKGFWRNESEANWQNRQVVL